MRLWCAVSSLLATAAVALAAPPAQAYEEAPVNNGGTIKGKVVYNGQVPTRTILPTKDQEVCGEMREEPEVMVGPDGGVQHAVVYLVGVEQGKAWPAEAQEPTLDNKDCTFQPNVQAIPAGKLGVHNSDPMLHNTHGFYGRRTAFNIALPNQGQTIDVDLERSGQVRIECDVHGWMRGWVYVVDNPYYVVTGEDGTFEITDVPSGEYTLVANQAYTGPVEVDVAVGAGETVEAPVELQQP
jgi:plastocyanin